MSITASNLIARISVDGAESATAKLLSVGSASDSAGAKLGKLAVGATVIAGAALVGVGVLFTKMAGDFQAGVTTLSTGAGELQSNLKMVGSGMLQTAVDTGTATKDLTDGMFMIESAGQHGSQALVTLTDAAEGAKVGMAPLKDVANGVTTAMTDYASSGLTAAQATNDLIATVSLGKTHMADLARAMSTILPTSAAVGVSLTDTSAAMATMTSEGTNASSAATYLKQLLIALEAPAKKGATALRDIGLTTAEVAAEMRISLPDALQMIMDHLKRTYGEGTPKFIAAMKDIAGGSRQMQGILELTGQHLKTFADDASSLAATLKRGGSSIIGWNQVQDDFNFKVDRARTAVEVFGIKIGTMLLPPIGKLVDQVAPLVGYISKLADQFAQLVTPVQNTAKAMQPVIDMSKPLLDTFDHASGVIKTTTRAWTPLLDTFDRAKSTIKDTTQVTKPFLDTFDRASGIIQSTTQAGNQVNPVLQTLYQGMKNVAQGAGDLVRFVQDVASNVQLAAPILAGLGAILTAILVPAMLTFAASTIAATWPFVTLGLAVGGLVALLLQFNPQITTIQGAFQMLSPIIQNTGIALAFFFTPALIKSGVEAVISAGKITINFIASMVQTGFEGWAAAGKLAIFIWSLITSGTEAVISGAKITGKFVAGLVTSALESEAAAGIMNTTIIPSLYGTGAAALAAEGPIIAFGAIAVATFALIANRAWDFNKQVQTSTNETVNVAQLRYHQLATGATASMDSMKSGVTNAANQTKTNVVDAFTIMAKQTYADTTTLSANAVANFQRLNGDLQSQMSSIDANIIGYWNDVAAYISSHQITGTVSWRSVGGPISPGGPAGATTSHNAMGTNFWQGGMTWVGERGPEIINLPRGSQVIPNHQINNVVGSSGSSGQPIQVNINLAGHRVAQVLLPELVQAIRNKTGARI